jgi:hypothetical protein
LLAQSRAEGDDGALASTNSENLVDALLHSRPDLALVDLTNTP